MININSSMKIYVLHEDFLKFNKAIILYFIKQNSSWTMKSRPPPLLRLWIILYNIYIYIIYMKIIFIETTTTYVWILCVHRLYNVANNSIWWTPDMEMQHCKRKSSSNSTKKKYKSKYLCKIDCNNIEVILF